MKKDKVFTVFLFRSIYDPKRCHAAIRTEKLCDRATFVVKLKANSQDQAKQRAIQAAVNYFDAKYRKIKIVKVNFDDPIFGINNFSDLKKLTRRWKKHVSVYRNSIKGA